MHTSQVTRTTHGERKIGSVMTAMGHSQIQNGSSVSTAMTCAANLQDCSFHPTENLLAAGIITGQVRIVAYSSTAAVRKSQKRLHEESCRAVQFSSQGDVLLTGSADKSIVLLDTATCKVQRVQQGAHPAGINRLAVLSDTTFASGLYAFDMHLHAMISNHPQSVRRCPAQMLLYVTQHEEIMYAHACFSKVSMRHHTARQVSMASCSDVDCG